MDKDLKANAMRRIFNIAAEEEFVDDIECGLKKSWHKSGRLWIFAEHMCYYSQMFGSEQKILIKNEAIRDVKVLKAKTAVGSSIDIQTKTDHCRLTSFKSKDGFEKCGRLIRNIVAQYHPNSESNSNINDQSLDAEQQRQHRFKQSFSALNAMSPPLRSHQQQSEPISPLQHGHHRAHSQSIGTSHDKGTGYGKHRSATQGEPLMLQLNNRRKTTASDSSDIGKDSNDEYESSDNIGNNNDNNNNNNGNKSKNKDLRKIKSAIDVDKKHGNVLDEMERGGNNFRPARKGSSSKPNEFLSSGSYGNSSYGTRNNNLVNHSSAGHHLGNQVNNLKILDSFEFQTDHFSSDPNIRKHRGSGSGTGTGGIGGTGNDNQTSNNDDKNKNNNKHNLSINHSINSNSNNVHNNSDSELNPRNKDRHYREARSFGDEVDMERDNDDNDDNDRTKKPEIYHRSSTKLECKDNEQSNEEFDTRRRSRKGAMSPGDENDNDNYSDEYNSQNYSRHRSSSDPGNKNNNNSSNSSIIDQIRVSTKQLLEKLDPKSNADGSKSKLKSKSKSKSKSRSNEKENDKEKGDKSKGSLHLGNSNSTGHIINGTANMKTTGDNTTENTSDCHDSPVVTSNDEDGGSAASKKRKHHKRHHGSHGKKRKKLKKSELEARLNGIPINDGLLGNGMFSKSKNKNTPDKQSSKKVDSGSAASLAIGNDGGGGVNEKHTSNNKNNNNGGEMNGSSNQEKKENDNGNGALSKYIDESYGNAKYVETKGNDKLDFELIGDTIIHATPVKIWQRLFETKDFANEMHKRRKATDVKIFEWIIDTEKNDEKWRKENNQPVTWLRKQEYIIPVKDAPPFMANTAQVYEAQRVRFFGKNRLCIDSRVATPKITYGDCFFLVHKQTFELIGPNQSKVTAYLGFDWVKNTWFKKVIQSKATAETRAGVDDWLTRVKEIYPKRSAQAGDINVTSALNNRSQLEYVNDRNDNDNNDGNKGGNAGRLPPGRFEKIMRLFHTEETKGQKLWKHYFEPTWVMILDILTIILDRQVWYNLFHDVKLLFTSKNENLIILSKEHIILIIMACLFASFCWTFFLFVLWIWYNQSFYYSLTESNQLLKQQTELLLQIIANGQYQRMNNISSIELHDDASTNVGDTLVGGLEMDLNDSVV